jgi:hypothetical protein
VARTCLTSFHSRSPARTAQERRKLLGCKRERGTNSRLTQIACSNMSKRIPLRLADCPSSPVSSSGFNDFDEIACRRSSICATITTLFRFGSMLESENLFLLLVRRLRPRKKSELSSEASREANARRMSTADKNLNESTICLLWRVQQTGCPPPHRHASKGNLNFSRNLCVELEVFL